ncbi:MAG: TlpA family protein disulfide reductase [Sedimentisphaerales bacterium]|nr:TlpA family protein disulfide reductase [Sedimentisphaerales bacterium]
MIRSVFLTGLLILACAIGGCRKRTVGSEQTRQESTEQATQANNPVQAEPAGEEPVVTEPQAKTTTDEIPRFAANSPFTIESEGQDAPPPKRLWADSFLWEQAPEIVVSKWLTDEPKTDGKYVLVECWATWCPPCRRLLPKLSAFAEKYADSLVVIGISEEEEEPVLQFMAENELKFHVGVDPQKRYKNALGVFGIPHAILIEPEEGVVVWEGFPLLEGHELTEEVIEHVLSVGRQRGVLPPA